MNEIEVGCGEEIGRACERLARAAPAFMVFNGVRVEAPPGAAAADLHARWSADMDRRRQEYEASDEHKRREAESKVRHAEESRVREESLSAISASGIREQCPWIATMGEISGFGGGYEAACRDMVYAGLAWLKNRPNADLSTPKTDDAKALDKVVAAACPDCSGAMHGAAMNAVAFIAKKGWDEYVQRMTEPAAQTGSVDR